MSNSEANSGSLKVPKESNEDETEEEEGDDSLSQLQNIGRVDHRRSSPVDLLSKDAVFSTDLYRRPLEVYYVETRETVLVNDGNIVRLLLTSPPSDLSGGPLADGGIYRLCEIRFHWGKSNLRGSEHTVNDHPFPMEVQLVHYNAVLFHCFEEALGNPKGVAIVTLFVQVGKQHNGLQPVVQNLWSVQYKGESKNLPVLFNPESLLPHLSLRDFWTYNGTLTWAPYSDKVTWILMRYPMTVSSLQIDKFRHLVTYKKGEFPPRDGGRMVDNFEPIRPLRGRVITSSFEY